MKSVRLAKTAMQRNRFLAGELLRQGPRGVKRFNRFRQRHPRYVPDFAGIGLNDLDLSGVNFRRANLIEASFINTRLDGADFTGALMFQVELSGASLKGARGIPAIIRDVKSKDYKL